MCGIVAVVGKIGSNEERAFKMLLELDTIRGPHSTGVLSVMANGEMEISKSVGTPWDLYDSKKFEKMFASKVHRVLLGHNRAATRGAITSKNAHPFMHGNIAGVHNGTLTQQSLLDQHHRFDVDSDNIYWHMNEHGVDDTVEKLNGAFALAWYDYSAHTFNMTRNIERPLSYCFSEDGLTMFAASEAWMLSVVLSKHTIKHAEIQTLEVGKLVGVDVPNKTNSKDRIDDPYIRPLEQHKKKVYSPPYTGYPTTSTTGTHGKPTTSGTTGAATGNVVELRPTKKENTTTQDIITLLSSYCGHTVQFFVTKSVRGGNKANKYTYVIAEAEEDPNVEVRLFVQESSKLYNKLMNSKNMFSAKIRGYNTYGQAGYLSIEPETLCEMKNSPKPKYRESEDKEDKTLALPNPNSVYSTANFIGPNGKALTYDQFRYAVRGGCVICSDPIDMTKCHGIEWLTNNKDYICEDCLKADDCQEVVEMARQMV